MDEISEVPSIDAEGKKNSIRGEQEKILKWLNKETFLGTHSTRLNAHAGFLNKQAGLSVKTPCRIGLGSNPEDAFYFAAFKNQKQVKLINNIILGQPLSEVIPQEIVTDTFVKDFLKKYEEVKSTIEDGVPETFFITTIQGTIILDTKEHGEIAISPLTPMGIAAEFMSMHNVIMKFSSEDRKKYQTYRHHIYVMFNEKNKGNNLANSGFPIGKDMGFGLLNIHPPKINQNAKEIFFGGLFDFCKESRIAIKKKIVTAIRARRRLVKKKQIDIDHRSKMNIQIGVETAMGLQYKKMIKIRNFIGKEGRLSSDADKPFFDGVITTEWKKRASELFIGNTIREIHNELGSPIVDIERELLSVCIKRFVYEKDWI